MNEFSCLVINCTLYICTFIFFLKKYGIGNISTILFLLYGISSVFSLLYFQQPLYYTSFTSHGTVKIEGILYLYVLNLLFCSAFRKFNLSCTDQISEVRFKMLQQFVMIIFFVNIVSLIVNFPDLFQIVVRGNFAAMKDDVYVTGGLLKSLFFVELFNRIFGGFKSLLLIFPLYNIFVLKTKRKIDLVLILTYFLLTLQTLVIMVSRSIVFISLIELLFIVILFKNYLDKKLKKKLLLACLIIIPVFWLIFSFMTATRFGGSSENAKAAQSYATIRYAGEAQLNFSGLMYDHLIGNSYGYKMFPLFRRALGLEYYGDRGLDKYYGMSYLDKLNPNPNNVYYQFSGEMYFNWGWWGALLIAIAFNLFMNKYIKHKGSFPFMKLVFVSWSATVLGVGVFYNNIMGDSSNMFLLLIIPFSLFMKKNSGKLNRV